MPGIAQIGPFSLSEAIDLLNPVPVEQIGPVDVNVVSGGLPVAAAPYSYIAAGSANEDAQVVKAAPGYVYAIVGLSAIATGLYLKLYDLATPPTSADTPVLRLPIPAKTGPGLVISLAAGILFEAGISFRITVGIADDDVAPATAGDCTVSLAFA